jgi:hypothetical protein
MTAKATGVAQTIVPSPDPPREVPRGVPLETPRGDPSGVRAKARHALAAKAMTVRPVGTAMTRIVRAGTVTRGRDQRAATPPRVVMVAPVAVLTVRDATATRARSAATATRPVVPLAMAAHARVVMATPVRTVLVPRGRSPVRTVPGDRSRTRAPPVRGVRVACRAPSDHEAMAVTVGRRVTAARVPERLVASTERTLAPHVHPRTSASAGRRSPRT